MAQRAKKIQCKQCKSRKNPNAFSSTQMKKNKNDRKCTKCCQKNQRANEQKETKHNAKSNDAKTRLIASDAQGSSWSRTQVPLASEFNNKALNSWNPSHLTDRGEVDRLLTENAHDQASASGDKTVVGVVADISMDCIKISGDVGSIQVEQAWKLERQNKCLVNTYCAVHVILRGLMGRCQAHEVRLAGNVLTLEGFLSAVSQADAVVDDQKSNNPLEDLNKLNGAMFTDKKEIEALLTEFQRLPPLASQRNGGTVLVEIGRDCMRVSGAIGIGNNVRDYLTDDELNMKWAGGLNEGYCVNNMCGPQIILRELVKGCRLLRIKIVQTTSFR